MHSCLDKGPFWETTETPAWPVQVLGAQGWRHLLQVFGWIPNKDCRLRTCLLSLPHWAGGSQLYPALPPPPAPLSREEDGQGLPWSLAW